MLSHVGPDFLIIRDSLRTFDSCEAELVIEVDGTKTQKMIRLPNGISEGHFSSVDYSVLF